MYLEARQQRCRFSGRSSGFGVRERSSRFSGNLSGTSRSSRHYRPVLAEVTHETGCGSQYSRRNCGVRFGTRCHIQPQTQRAVQRPTQLAAERAGQTGTRCVTDSRIEAGVDAQTDSGAEVPSLCGVGCGAEGATGCHVEPRVRREAEERAKSLIDGHIDGRVVFGLEPRSQPGSDSHPADAGLRQNSGPSSRTSPQTHWWTFARSVQCHAFRVTVTLAHSAGPASAWQAAGSKA